MLAAFYTWWIARITELLPTSWTDAVTGAPDGIVVDLSTQAGHRYDTKAGHVTAGHDVTAGRDVTVYHRRRGRREPLTLGAAARLAARQPVFLRPAADAVLEKHHVVPTAPRRELDQMLRYELVRITPFSADDLFWRWDSRPRTGDKSRTDVTLTLVPKAAMTPALEMLAKAGIRPRCIEVGPAERPRLLPMQGAARQPAGDLLVRGLAWTCGGLAAIALLLPVVLQERALLATDSAIDALQPTIRQVEALRRDITADGAGQVVLAQEMARTGDVLQVLATVTRILPDDTYLTDFSLRERQMVLGGRSAGSARLITGLSADPSIRDAAFAAPVTRIEGASADVFSIRASIAP
jgi:general secretion pathway protein L